MIVFHAVVADICCGSCNNDDNIMMNEYICGDECALHTKWTASVHFAHKYTQTVKFPNTRDHIAHTNYWKVTLSLYILIENCATFVFNNCTRSSQKKSYFKITFFISTDVVSTR